jgi:predicted phosphodiesterase
MSQEEPNNISTHLDQIFKDAYRRDLADQSRWVIFSDLHMGDGGATDDFKTNSELFKSVLKDYYLVNEYALLLNGDVEELQRFKLSDILKQWKDIYGLFDLFNKGKGLVKNYGNHDLQLSVDPPPYDYQMTEACKLSYGSDDIFIYHGHQASKKYQSQNHLVGFTLKYFANPLRIKNYSVSRSSKKQYKIEKRAYEYAIKNKQIGIIGHTHRPLFESLHKVDRLRFKIDQLCRDYLEPSKPNKSAIVNSIKFYQSELEKSHRMEKLKNLKSFIYHQVLAIPCLFNSGTVIGKRGITCLEIADGKIRLIHWFDQSISKKYLQVTGYDPEPLTGTDFFRMVINEDSLDYVFARIKLLS